MPQREAQGFRIFLCTLLCLFVHYYLEYIDVFLFLLLTELLLLVHRIMLCMACSSWFCWLKRELFGVICELIALVYLFFFIVTTFFYIHLKKKKKKSFCVEAKPVFCSVYSLSNIRSAPKNPSKEVSL